MSYRKKNKKHFNIAAPEHDAQHTHIHTHIHVWSWVKTCLDKYHISVLNELWKCTVIFKQLFFLCPVGLYVMLYRECGR